MASGELIEAITTKYSGYRGNHQCQHCNHANRDIRTRYPPLVSLIFSEPVGFLLLPQHFPPFSVLLLWDEGNSTLCPSQII